MMKTPDQLVADIVRRLRATWHIDAAQPDAASGAPPWPHTFPIGTVAKADLESEFDRFQKAAFEWRDWAAAQGLHLTDSQRVVHGTTQRIPTHVTIPSVDVAARLCGKAWVDRLSRGRTRADVLHRRFSSVPDRPRLIRDVDAYTDVDFDLLCRTAEWFRANSASGLTPRQVPVPGLHAKWLNSHNAEVAVLAGIPSLDLLPRHPARLHLTYLDPDHRANRGRWQDTATVGDAMIPPYTPSVIVISENKDTAIHFPVMAGGISVEGMGHGGATAASLQWLRDCPNLFYWGDMDAAGFEILNGFRAAGLAVSSILMDVATYEQFEQFGTAMDVRGNPLSAPTRRTLVHLTIEERQLYDRLTDPTWVRYRRIEQERIPLPYAAETVRAMLATGRQPHIGID